MSDTDIKDRIRSAMFSGMSMSLRDDLCEMLDDLWFETATQAAALTDAEAALTDAEATIAALTQANAALAQDNARLGKRVERARGQVEDAYLEGFGHAAVEYRAVKNAGQLDPVLTKARASWVNDSAARAWLAGGDA